MLPANRWPAHVAGVRYRFFVCESEEDCTSAAAVGQSNIFGAVEENPPANFAHSQPINPRPNFRCFSGAAQAVSQKRNTS